MRTMLPVLLLVAVVLGLASAGRTEAQELIDRSISTQLFQPSVGPEPALAVERASVFPHLRFGIGLFVNYQHHPYSAETVYRAEDGMRGAQIVHVNVVTHQLTEDLVGALGLRYGWLRGQIGLALPVHLMVAGHEMTELGAQGDNLGGTNVGDLRLQLKVGLLSDWKRLSLAFAAVLTMPTGCAAAGGEDCAREGIFNGEAGVTGRPFLIADYRIGAFTIAANVGWLFREKSFALSTAIDDRLTYGAGVTYDVNKRIAVLAEVAGQAGFAPSLSCRTYANHSHVCKDPGHTNYEAAPLEGMLAGNLQLNYGLSLLAGLGAGIIRGIGSPEVRALAGLRWTPDFSDSDKDGIGDLTDACPMEPEDRDGFQDSDGCPELDNDGDLIPDDRDRCPNSAEDRDSFQDEDGCPELDNDGDGIPDLKDSCPFQPENKNGFQDEDGCPDEPDRDNDGIEDRADLCPDQPETVNGYEDGDGCPDEGELIVQQDEIVLRNPLVFTGAQLRDSDPPALVQLVRLLKTASTIGDVRIIGVAGQPGPREELWHKRAEAIQRYLVEQGVEPTQLFVEGAVTLKGPGAATASMLQRTGGIVLLTRAPAPQPQQD